MSNVVLDASAILALFNAEAGADKVSECVPGAIISAVNLSEVIAKLNSFGIPEGEIYEDLEPFQLDVRPFDKEQAYQTGMLRAATKSASISLGDRACLALARNLGVAALTSDKSWKDIKVGVIIQLIR